jgi:peptidoglycan/LPS O-acetylase OafA/YrhL
MRTEHRSFNAIRSVSAVLVVMYHLRTVLFVPDEAAPNTPLTGALYVLTNLGPGAVVVFFVLSGYWVGGSVFAADRRGTFRWSTYGIARLTRLWVVLLPALALTAVVDRIGQSLFSDRSIYAGDPAYHGVVPQDLAAHTTAPAAVGTAFFVNTNLVPTFGTDGSLWSLAYEASYYAILPLTLCAWRERRSLRAVGYVVLIAVIGVVGGFDVLMFLPVWLLGALVARYRAEISSQLTTWSPQVRRAARAIAGAATAAALCGTGVAWSSAAVATLSVTTTVFVALLVDDVTWTGLPGRAIGSLSRYAGASFSLYAMHLPLVVLVQAFLVEDAELRWAPTFPHWVGLAALVSLLTLAGWGFARVTEHHTDRVRRIVQDRLIPNRSAAPTG